MLLVCAVRVDASAVDAGSRGAFVDVALAVGAGESRGARALVRVGQRRAPRPVATRRQGAVVDRLALVAPVTVDTGAAVDVQRLQKAST